MDNQVTIQVQMDAKLNQEVELLYKELGTTFTEAIRIFAKQSIAARGLPFALQLDQYGSTSPESSVDVLMKYSGSVSRTIDYKKELEEARNEKYESTD